MKIFINAISVKRRAGGVFQVAKNFINFSANEKGVIFYYLVSQDLISVLDEKITSLKDQCFVFPTQPDFFRSYRKVARLVAEIEEKVNPDIVYSLASPSYFSFKAIEVLRYTNPWITNPNKYAYDRLSTKEKIRNLAYLWNQKRLIRSSSFFITQTEEAKNGIIAIANVPKESVKVIPNVLPQFYITNHIPRETTRILNTGEETFNIACIAAGMKHKNLDIIPNVLFILKRKYNLQNVVFHITICETSSIWKQIKNKAGKLNVLSQIKNHGICSQTQLASIYRSSSLFFFPTLLEVFSASLLEAMFFKLPIVTTNFSFNTEITKDCALYYQPSNAEEAASHISMLMRNSDLRQECIKKSEQILKNYLNYRNHFDETIDFLKLIATSC